MNNDHASLRLSPNLTDPGEPNPSYADKKAMFGEKHFAAIGVSLQAVEYAKGGAENSLFVTSGEGSFEARARWVGRAVALSASGAAEL